MAVKGRAALDASNLGMNSDSWWHRANYALIDFVGAWGNLNFTCADFQRWAPYYHGLEEPPSPGHWGLVFRHGSWRNRVRPTSKARKRVAKSDPHGFIWAA